VKPAIPAKDSVQKCFKWSEASRVFQNDGQFPGISQL